MFEEFRLAKKCRFKALQGESSLDGRMVEMGLLQHLEEVEDFESYRLVSYDFVAEQSRAEVLWCEAYNQLIMREFLNEQVNGFFPKSMIFKAIPNKTTLSSIHVILARACGRQGIYGCVLLMFTL